MENKTKLLEDLEDLEESSEEEDYDINLDDFDDGMCELDEDINEYVFLNEHKYRKSVVESMEAYDKLI